MNETHSDASTLRPGESRSIDPEAWVDRHGDALYRYALMRLRDPEMAAELVQEAFLHAFRGRGAFDGRSSERTWLVSILRHKLIDYLRKSGREKSIDPDGLGDERIFDRAGRWLSMPGRWEGNPGEDMERREFWSCFEDCLSRLPSNVSDAFLLRELEDCGADDVCEVLQITPANLHTRLYRARLLLRDCLGRRWFGAAPSKNRGGQ
jgi:RNA polymerase sigma-70 factor (TIGR02943 family)